MVLQQGEQALEYAPSVKLKNGKNCIPQHYLRYKHTLESVQNIILNCHFNKSYLIFASSEGDNIYIQIGIIGYDNYISLSKQSQKKIVYGRKWRVEPELPTSEIIQTIFLALKKAREHEVRELFKLSLKKSKTTPFSNHHDLPLMAKNASLLEVEEKGMSIDDFVKNVRRLLLHTQYDSGQFNIVDIEKRKNGDILVDINLSTSKKTQLLESGVYCFTLLLKKPSINEFLFKLMEALIYQSDREVEEHFSYMGFKRFSQNNSVFEIAELSCCTRDTSHIENDSFLKKLEKTNYEVDKNRAPVITNAKLSKKLAQDLSRFGKLDGVMPFL